MKPDLIIITPIALIALPVILAEWLADALMLADIFFIKP